MQVRDIAEARHFYGDVLGLSEGRSDDHWVDFDMYGHQFVVHLNAQLGPDDHVPGIHNPVDGDAVPVPHCGVVLEVADWQTLAARLRGRIDTFVIEPHVRFAGEAGEQHTMFFLDPSGNALEFKAFKDIEGSLFAR